MWHAWERREKCTRFWWESLKERDHLEDRGGDGVRSEVILGRLAGCVFVFVCVCACVCVRACVRACARVEWIQLTQDRGRWRALVNTVMNLWVLVPQSWLLS
jgi:hypothetical protein